MLAAHSRGRIGCHSNDDGDLSTKHVIRGMFCYHRDVEYNV